MDWGLREASAHRTDGVHGVVGRPSQGLCGACCSWNAMQTRLNAASICSPWQGYSWAEDKEHCEEYGRMLNADPSKAGLWVTGGWELRLLERHPKVHSRAVKHFEHSACHQLIPPLRCLPATGVGACQEAGAATDGHPGGGQPLRRDSGGQSSPWLACIVCRCA